MFRYAQNNVQLYEQLRRCGYDDTALQQVAKAYDFALRLFAGRYRGSGKPFIDHLVGTASVLVGHGAALPTVLAGLLHAAYRHGEWGTGRRGPSVAKRRQLADVIGTEAEDLVMQYDSFDWDRLKREGVAEIVGAMDDAARETVFMHVANDLEESVNCSLLYTGREILDEHVDWMPYWADAARCLGRQDLAEEVEAALRETTGGAPLVDLPGQRRWPHTRVPLSHGMRPRYILIRLIKAAQRRLALGDTNW